jgi:spore maturation protein CgeB
MKRVLFVASLHHPETLLREQAGGADFLFPSSNSYHFYEKELRQRGYTLDVFWRNLPASAKNAPQAAKSQKFEEGLSLKKLMKGVSNRVPPHLNPEVRARNVALIHFARQFQPEVVWGVGDNREIYPETLAAIKKEHGCTIVYASGTSPIVFSHKMERDAARLYGWVICNDFYHGVQWQELGSKKMLCLPIAAADPTFHAPRTLTEQEQQRYACDVSFVGTLLPHNLYSERVEALAALKAFNLGIWSVHDVPNELRPFLRGKALGDEMMRVLSASSITVNPHGDFMRYGGNMRLFEAAAMNVFQLVDDRPGVREWFDVGQHLVIYRDNDDLQKKVTYYLAHPDERQAIAAAAREHVLAHHTYGHRVTALQNWGVL